MGAGVAVEIDAVQAASHFPVAQYPLGTVAEGEDANALRSGGDGGGQLVHFNIGHTVRDDVAAHPGIQDAGSVDAEQHAQAGLGGAVIHVGEAVHPRKRIVAYRAAHPVHHTGGTGGGGYLARVEYIE